MTTAQIQTLTEVIKVTAIEMMKAGYTGTQIATAIGSKFGNGVARLIMADIALDLGMAEQTKRYIARF
jgi:hypothetical protein